MSKIVSLPGVNGLNMCLYFHNRPPRYMGEGFVVVQTADCKITYYQDEPGEFQVKEAEHRFSVVSLIH